MLRSAGILASLIWEHPANRHRRLRALASAAAWQLYKRTARRPLDIEAFGHRFRCHPDSHDASRMIYFNSLPDPQEMEFMRRYLRRGDRVIDAGANVGIYTLFFASLVGPDGFILAFEPDPMAANRLRENIAINGLANVSVRQAALSDFHGTARFTQGADTGNTLYSIRTFDRPPQDVEVTCLSREINSETYALCKLDIEGAELSAIAGLGDRRIPVLTIELSRKALARSGYSVGTAKQWLEKKGYRLFHARGGQLSPFTTESRKPGHVGDAIAVREDAIEAVTDRLAEG